MTSRFHTGPLFRDVIAEIITKKSARSYLEIGVRDGSTLRMIACPAIGVDPAFDIASFPFAGKSEVHFYQKTSDVFFRDHDPSAVFGRKVDVVFLDGLHLLEYVLRDFINSEKHCSRNSLIIVDDCLPVNAEMVERYHHVEARRDRDTAGWWTGDVWKIIPLLKRWRPDLRVSPIDTVPTGSLFVTNLNPASTVLEDRYFDILAEARSLSFDMQGFYSGLEVIPATDVLHGFDFSAYAGY